MITFVKNVEDGAANVHARVDRLVHWQVMGSCCIVFGQFEGIFCYYILGEYLEEGRGGKREKAGRRGERRGRGRGLRRHTPCNTKRSIGNYLIVSTGHGSTNTFRSEGG